MSDSTEKEVAPLLQSKPMGKRTIMKKLLSRIRSALPASKGQLSCVEASTRAAMIDLKDALQQPVRNLPYELADTKIGPLLTAKSDVVIGEALRKHGGAEESQVDLALSICRLLHKEVKLTTFVDVGANIGTHALRALQIGFDRAVCIEPDALNFRLLRINQILCEVESRCLNANVAASNGDGEASLALSFINHGDHQIVMENDHYSAYGDSARLMQPIQLRPLDAILDSMGVSASEIGLAWIDTQGHEGHVLDGAEEFLRAGVPFVAEFWPLGLVRSGGWKRLRTILSDLDRPIYQLGSSARDAPLPAVSIEDLDRLFEEWRSHPNGPHSDLMVI